jgi:glycosyltransferase 2 family protein
MTPKRILFLLASILVSVISLYLILQNVPIDDVVASIQQADVIYLIIAFVFITLSMFTRGIRWWGLLGYRIPLIQTSHIINVTFLGNQLPFRMGEIARSLLAIQGGVPVVTSATSIVVERLVDMLIVVIMIAGAVSQLSDVPQQITQSATVFGILAIIGFTTLLILARMPELAQNILDRILKLIPLLARFPLKTILNHVLDGLQPLTEARTLIFTIVWSLIAWSMSLASFYFLHQALGININYAVSVPLGIGLASLSVALPVSVAALGPFEAAIVLTGQLVGMESLDAVSLGFLLHGMSVMAYALWGVIGLIALGVSPSTAFKTKNDSLVDNMEINTNE